MGTHLRVLSESYPMNTNMTGFRWFSENLCILVLWTKVASALEGLIMFPLLPLNVFIISITIARFDQRVTVSSPGLFFGKKVNPLLPHLPDGDVKWRSRLQGNPPPVHVKDSMRFFYVEKGYFPSHMVPYRFYVIDLLM